MTQTYQPSAVFTILLMAFCSVAVGQEPPQIGIDSNYVLDMMRRHMMWRDQSVEGDPFVFFARHGCKSARIRLWVGDDGNNRLKSATAMARLAQQAGLKPYLVLFLSDNWADLVKQPIPAPWAHLSSEAKVAAVKTYAEDVVRHMASCGIAIDTFAIGNEIDFGICGDFEEQWPHRVSIEYMRTQVWPRMVSILKAAQKGVLNVQPKARFIVHLAQWNNIDYCIAFWRFMDTAGVRMDELGLSYYPSASDNAKERSFEFLRGQVAKAVDALHKPVIICETGYPATANFGGQFATWNHPADGYPLSDAGQAKWITDLVGLVRKDHDFAGMYYWSPEWYGDGLWDAFALFDSRGNGRPGIRSFESADTSRLEESGTTPK